jgi:hypothetical protein
VAVGEQRDEETFHDGFLADDGLADFFTEFLGPSGTGGHTRDVGKGGKEGGGLTRSQ